MNYERTVIELTRRPQRRADREYRKPLPARADQAIERVSSIDLRPGDKVVVEASQVIPGDGEVIEGGTLVNEAAITGESAPVIREAGGDRSGVTGGTTVLSDRIIVRISAGPGESFLDQMIALVEGARRQRTPNEIALTLVLTAFSGPKPFPEAEARHLDGNPANNHRTNLVWATHRENEGDKARHGTKPTGARNGMARLTEQDVINIRLDYAELRSLTKTAAKYGIVFQTVSDIINRKSWSHVG